MVFLLSLTYTDIDINTKLLTYNKLLGGGGGGRCAVAQILTLIRNDFERYSIHVAAQIRFKSAGTQCSVSLSYEYQK